MGVGPPGRTGRDQLTALREQVLPTLLQTGSVPTVAVCCQQAPPAHVAALRGRGAHIHPVSCVGNLHSSVIEFLLRSGAPGVIVFGCPSRDCVGREGPKWLRERLFNDREAELQARVDRRRVGIATLAAGDLAGTVAAYQRFADQLPALPPPEPEPNPDFDTVCEPVPMEEAAP
jgi:coenzyme F420-reducing hydrogenase delta subunit